MIKELFSGDNNLQVLLLFWDLQNMQTVFILGIVIKGRSSGVRLFGIPTPSLNCGVTLNELPNLCSCFTMGGTVA